MTINVKSIDNASGTFRINLIIENNCYYLESYTRDNANDYWRLWHKSIPFIDKKRANNAFRYHKKKYI